MSPITDSYDSTVIEVRASFGFSDFECSPNDITEALELTPDCVLVQGEKRSLVNGHEVINKSNSWMINSRTKSKDVNDHLRELLDRLLGKSNLIRQEWSPFFEVIWKGNYLYAGSGPFYERDVITGISHLGASLYQDIYQVDETETD